MLDLATHGWRRIIADLCDVVFNLLKVLFAYLNAYDNRFSSGSSKIKLHPIRGNMFASSNITTFHLSGPSLSTILAQFSTIEVFQ